MTMMTITTTIVLFLSKHIIQNAKAETNERIYSIRHNLGNGFQPRSSNIHLGLKQQSLYTELVPTTATTCNNEDQECIDELDLFKSLVANEKMYQLKVIDQETNNEVIMSVPSCSVLRSNFREEVTLHLNPTGDLISISYKPLISPLAPKQCSTENLKSKDDKQLNFTTTISIDTFTPAMTIPLVLPAYRPQADVSYFASFKSRMSQQQQQVGSDGKPIPGEGLDDQNQGFLRKYWYIILPVMIMSLFNGAPPEEGGAGEAAAGTQATPSPRRGKRN